ncbi:MAG: insulinase family protein [Eubacterium sp.]|nr:insulinase family protein [Eubacterium sp.]
MNIKNTPAYELITSEEIQEVNSTGYLLFHKKTKARVVVLENDDDNKVFDIGFRTPPVDSTGVPHIVEHTVLCGSRKFPVKDPFAELDKGSLNTFLNAMTYPDKTVYPVASVNDKDFRNLMDVYLDAVFFPNLHEEEKIFRQEGWHYELEDPDGELTYNGVVFNEMKGAFSSPDEYFDTLIQSTLFPDNSYGVVSGGDPKVIPELTWEAYRDFHRRYYHPSNSYIYLYGNMDMEERLNWIDSEYLSQFDFLEVDSEIRLQPAFEEMREADGYYPIPAGEPTEGKTYFAYSAVCGSSLDPHLSQAFQVLEYALVEATGAPIKEALVKAGIGTEIDGSYSEPFRQPFFTISAKNANDEQKGEFLRTIRETLMELVEKGINKRSLKAALNAMEFQFREADFGRFPKGLMYGLGIYDSWLYDDRTPFLYLHVNDTFSYLREQVETDYFENLIQTYLLDNTHSAFVSLRPKPGMATEVDEQERVRLAAYREQLSREEREEIVRQTAELKKYQEEPSTPEQMATIPRLGREDIGKKARPIRWEERDTDGVKTVFNDVFTNGITYLKLSFDITDLREYAPYIALLADVLGVMDTDSHDKLELSNELLLHAGGYSISTGVHNHANSDDYCVRFEVSVKVLYHETAYVLGIIDEILHTTHLNDSERLKEILAERRSIRQASLPSVGHSTAINRGFSYFREEAAWMENMRGIGYYDFLCKADDEYERYGDDIISVLQWLNHVIFDKKRLIINVISTPEGYDICEKALPGFLMTLADGVSSTDTVDGHAGDSDVGNGDTTGRAFDRWVSGGREAGSYVVGRTVVTSNRPEPLYKTPEIPKNEGIATAGNVQYVARVGDFRRNGVEYHGSFRVLKTILSYEYLWNEVRVKGGAYGVMCGFSHTGTGYIVSYRDPHLRETNEIYQTVAGYLRSFDVSEEDIVKFIIGTVRSMDAPLTPHSEGARSYEHYMSGVTIELLQKTRDEVLSTTVEDIRRTADMIDAIMANNLICVLGGEEPIHACEDMFDTIRTLV